MNIHFIKSSEKKRILEQLNEQFGIEELPYLLIESGKEKIRGFSGHLSIQEMQSLAGLANIESIGLYIIRKEHDLRLSFDATHLLSKQISKKVVEISDFQVQQWLRGYDLEIPGLQFTGTVIVKHKNFFLGCGKAKEGKILNHVPKERRLKNKLVEIKSS